MMVCTNTKFMHNGKDNRWAEYDAGQAAVSLCLQAAALGLVTHQMGGFDVKAVREKFVMSDDVQPMAALALGYLAEADGLADGFKDEELQPRTRKPLEELMIHADDKG